MYYKHWAWSITDGSARNAAHEQALYAVATMGAHHDQVNAVFLCQGGNRLIGFTFLDKEVRARYNYDETRHLRTMSYIRGRL